MQGEAKQPEVLSNAIQESMRALVSAIRTVKIYPPNNPVYAQSVKKAYELLALHLADFPDYTVGIKKTYFTYEHTPFAKEAQLNKALAQDLFLKGMREIVFTAGLTEAELMELCRALALSVEQLGLKSGISTILWEKGIEHVKVSEAGLDEVIETKSTAQSAASAAADNAAAKEVKHDRFFSGRTIVLGELISDPAGFAFSMLELARQTKGEYETVEDRLFAIYQEAGRKIEEEHGGEADAMFEGLAKSVLTLEPNFRDAMVAGKLYRDLDTEMAVQQAADSETQLPTALNEVQAGRFTHAWTVQNVSKLLKRSSAKAVTAPSVPPTLAQVQTIPLSADIAKIAQELAQYSPEEMEDLKALSSAGVESDVLEATVRTFINLLPLARNRLNPQPSEEEFKHFAGIVRQLEEILAFYLKDHDFDRATHIIQAFHTPVDPAFQPRMSEAIRRTATSTIVKAAIADLRKHPKESPAYKSAYAYVSKIEREATEVLLDLLAEEKDRNARIFYLDLVKDIGKNQITLMGELLSDGRWYFVRNIVNILGESKTEQAIAFLRKAADHENVRIRQEVIKGLLTIGGKKAAAVLAKFLRDKDETVQETAIHAFADFPGIGAEEAKPLLTFLEGRRLGKKDHKLTLEAIAALGKTGGRDAAQALKQYTVVKWWKPRKLQNDLRDAATLSIAEITRRIGDGGRTQRQP